MSVSASNPVFALYLNSVRHFTWNHHIRFQIIAGNVLWNPDNLVSSPFNIQPDQINMAMLFWYFVKGDASVRYFIVIGSYVIQGTRTTWPCINGYAVRPVCHSLHQILSNPVSALNLNSATKQFTLQRNQGGGAEPYLNFRTTFRVV